MGSSETPCPHEARLQAVRDLHQELQAKAHQSPVDSGWSIEKGAGVCLALNKLARVLTSPDAEGVAPAAPRCTCGAWPADRSYENHAQDCPMRTVAQSGTSTGTPEVAGSNPAGSHSLSDFDGQLAEAQAARERLLSVVGVLPYDVNAQPIQADILQLANFFPTFVAELERRTQAKWSAVANCDANYTLYREARQDIARLTGELKRRTDALKEVLSRDSSLTGHSVATLKRALTPVPPTEKENT